MILATNAGPRPWAAARLCRRCDRDPSVFIVLDGSRCKLEMVGRKRDLELASVFAQHRVQCHEIPPAPLFHAQCWQGDACIVGIRVDTAFESRNSSNSPASAWTSKRDTSLEGQRHFL